jgi:hypothetical protein
MTGVAAGKAQNSKMPNYKKNPPFRPVPLWPETFLPWNFFGLWPFGVWDFSA